MKESHPNARIQGGFFSCRYTAPMAPVIELLCRSITSMAVKRRYWAAQRNNNSMAFFKNIKPEHLFICITIRKQHRHGVAGRKETLYVFGEFF